MAKLLTIIVSLFLCCLLLIAGAAMKTHLAPRTVGTLANMDGTVTHHVLEGPTGELIFQPVDIDAPAIKNKPAIEHVSRISLPEGVNGCLRQNGIVTHYLIEDEHGKLCSVPVSKQDTK